MLCVLTRGDFNFCVCSSPLQGSSKATTDISLKYKITIKFCTIILFCFNHVYIKDVILSVPKTKIELALLRKQLDLILSSNAFFFGEDTFKCDPGKQGEQILKQFTFKGLITKVLYLARSFSWPFFTKTSSKLHPLHVAGCLTAKWQHIKSKEVKHALLLVVKICTRNTAVTFFVCFSKG